jgi:hypothetical protein
MFSLVHVNLECNRLVHVRGVRAAWQGKLEVSSELIAGQEMSACRYSWVAMQRVAARSLIKSWSIFRRKKWSDHADVRGVRS